MAPFRPPIGKEDGGGPIGKEDGDGVLYKEEGTLPGGFEPTGLQVLTIGAVLFHGITPTGTVSTGSALSFHNEVGVIRTGDLATCSLHGPTTVIATSTLIKDQGLAIAREGDLTACGAILTPAIFPGVWYSA